MVGFDYPSVLIDSYFEKKPFQILMETFIFKTTSEVTGSEREEAR